MPLPRLFRPVLVLIALTLVLFGPVPSPAAPASDEGYTVRGVSVDVTAASASDARTRALAEAQLKAARELLERLTRPSDHGRLPRLDETTVVNMVRDVTVDTEKSSSVRYIASLTVRFKPASVRALLRGGAIAFIEPASRPVVVIPVFQERPESAPQLWEEGNPWRTAWTHRVGGGGLVPVTLPLGDLADVGGVTAQQAVAGDAAALAAVARRLGTDEVLVVHAVVAGGSPPAVDVRMVRVPVQPVAAAPEAVVMRTEGAMGEAIPDVLEKASRAVVARLEDDWKSEGVAVATATADAPPAQLTALVPLTSIEDWLAVRRTLGKIRLVSRVQVQAMKRDMAQVTLHYVGAERQLVASLAQHGLRLEPGADAVWTLERLGSPNQGATQAPTAPATAE